MLVGASSGGKNSEVRIIPRKRSKAFTTGQPSNRQARRLQRKAAIFCRRPADSWHGGAAPKLWGFCKHQFVSHRVCPRGREQLCEEAEQRAGSAMFDLTTQATKPAGLRTDESPAKEAAGPGMNWKHSAIPLPLDASRLASCKVRTSKG